MTNEKKMLDFTNLRDDQLKILMVAVDNVTYSDYQEKHIHALTVANEATGIPRGALLKERAMSKDQFNKAKDELLLAISNAGITNATRKYLKFFGANYGRF